MRLLLSVVLALTFVPAAAAGLPNPCTLLTNAEVATAFGAKVQSRVGESHRFGRSCAWEGVPLGSFTSAHASLRVDIAHVSRAQFLKNAKEGEERRAGSRHRRPCLRAVHRRPVPDRLAARHLAEPRPDRRFLAARFGEGACSFRDRPNLGTRVSFVRWKLPAQTDARETRAS
jgi:hypothetical protein